MDRLTFSVTLSLTDLLISTVIPVVIIVGLLLVIVYKTWRLR